MALRGSLKNMKLSISNIAWSHEKDTLIYKMMSDWGYNGLEIAPTRIIQESPYDHISEAYSWKNELKSKYGFDISSMQSIWYGRKENLFGTKKERETLLSYSKKAVLYAESLGCGNIVFGCPRNRVLPEGVDAYSSLDFFREIGNFAYEHSTVFAIEANPVIYGTNFINTTGEAMDLIEAVDSKGFMLNLDLGTMIENDESVSIIKDKVHLFNHIHVSEPGLKTIEHRDMHKEIAEVLRDEKYSKYVSIEIGKQDDMNEINGILEYVKKVFG